MRQVFLEGNGEIAVHEVDTPEISSNGILTRTAFSLISTGTETIGIKSRRSHANPAAAETPIGYSNSGTVVKVGADISGVAEGDRVGCYGSQYGFGGHSEMCHINKHLFVKLPGNVTLREAAFTGLGGIALQAVRRAELKFGEDVVVMGLGILGQLVARICSAVGYRVLATDFLDNRLDLANSAGITAMNAGDNVEDAVLKTTEGHGADAVMVCVAANSPEPLEQALRLIRFRGRVVLVGVAKIEIERNLFFSKEADLVISRAAGPGRYDPAYERDGVDMPYSYVRWTEGRNLKEFIRLISEKRVRVDDLISHEYPVERAAEAYEQILNHPNETLGVALKYE